MKNRSMYVCTETKRNTDSDTLRDRQRQRQRQRQRRPWLKARQCLSPALEVELVRNREARQTDRQREREREREREMNDL